MNLPANPAERLAQAKARRLNDRLDFLAFHGDFILIPMLIGAFAVLYQVLS